MRARWIFGAALGAAFIGAVPLAAATITAPAPEHGYVTSSLSIPTTGSQATAYGRDIDGDGHVDNGLAQLFKALAAQGLTFQTDTDGAIQNGDLLMLGSLRSRSFVKTKSATWQVLYAEPTATPDFSGVGAFTVDAAAPKSLVLPATIRAHQVTTKRGIIPVRLSFGGIITLRLKEGEIFATCSLTSCTKGRLTGVLTKNDVKTQLIPQLATHFTLLVTRDCPNPGPPVGCSDGTPGKTLESLFDANHDLVISSTELTQNKLLKSLLAPDIDLNHDKVRDALSVGLGFGAVHAKLVR